MSDDDQQNDPYKAPFLYTSKASSSERDDGCEHLYWKYENKTPHPISEEEYERLEDKDGVRVAQGNVHPTCKPIEVMEWLMERLTEPGDKVLDPFAGSGTTGIAAMKTGRNCQLIELDDMLDDEDVYKDIIMGRMHAHKTKMQAQAEHIDKNVQFDGELPEHHPNEVCAEMEIDELFDL